MANRRALIVTPLYDGKWLPPLSGSATLVTRLTDVLERRGDYAVILLGGDVPLRRFRETVTRFFETPGEVLLYFYGHGCLGPADLGYFATTDAAPFAEGLLMQEVNALAQQSPASEVVLIYDCCHAGASSPISTSTLKLLADGLLESDGRDILAACSAHQSSWEATNTEHKKLGVFSSHILDGLEGLALPRKSTKIRGSVLGEYVTRQFQEWNQDPISYCRETGMQHCVITSGFPVETETSDKKNARVFGAPFKPSNVFVGRSAELEGLIDTLVGGDRPVAVSATVEGLGGIGKTELVLQLLHHPTILGAYDAIVWLDAAGPLAPQWEKLAEDAGIRLPKKRPENFLKSLEKGLRELGDVLVVLDNATEWGAAEEWVPVDQPLLVTTRTRDFGGNRFVHSELRLLADEAAVEFLTEMIPEIRDDSGLPRLIKKLGGHALALELAGWNIKYVGLSPAEYIERLQRHTKDSDFALSAIRYGNTVDGCMELTWDSLRHDESRTLWRRASLFAPTSAHRDLLRVSAAGGEESRHHLEQMLEYMERYGGDELPEEFEGVNAASDMILNESAKFDEAYAELRAFHILARVEGYNGERWAMHRIVRDFGRARLRTNEVVLHGTAIAEWLRDPSLPLRPEIPHIVVTMLDSARQQGPGARFFAREHLHRSGSDFNENFRYYIEFIRDELDDPKALSLILEGLTDVNEDVRIQSIRLLEEVGSIPEVFEALQASLDDPDPAVRRRAGVTLAKHGGTKTIEMFSEAIRGPNLRARLTAIQALGLMGDKAHVALNEALDCGDGRVEAEAALLLCEQGQRSGVPVLLDRLVSVRGRQEGRVVASLGESREPGAIDSLAELFRNGRRLIRAITGLRKAGGEQAFALIESFLDHDHDAVRCAAAEAIDAAGTATGLERIISALARAELDSFGRFPGVVQEMARKRKTKLPVPAEVKLLKDHDRNVRMKCAIRFGKAKPRESVDGLVDALSDYDGDVRREAAKALGKIGDTRAIARLEEIREKDSVPGVQKAAKDAVNQIRRKA